jgi:hypothetical protein
VVLLKKMVTHYDVIPQAIHHLFDLAERTVGWWILVKSHPCRDPAEPHLNSAMGVNLRRVYNYYRRCSFFTALG